MRLKIPILIALGVTGVLFCLSDHSVRADVAPVPNAPGSNISPEDGTKVQMVAERGEIHSLTVI